MLIDDATTSSVTYIGKADMGSATSSAVWQIRRVDESGSYPKIGWADGDDSFVIKKSKIRGEASMGMICAEDELQIGESHDGIMVVNQEYEIGADASKYFPVENKRPLFNVAGNPILFCKINLKLNLFSNFSNIIGVPSLEPSSITINSIFLYD